RLPIGSARGQSRVASVALITTTFGESGDSVALNTRPFSRRMPSVSKYPALTGLNAALGSLARSGTGLSPTMKIEFQLDPSIGSEYASAAFVTPGSARRRDSRSA